MKELHAVYIYRPKQYCLQLVIYIYIYNTASCKPPANSAKSPENVSKGTYPYEVKRGHCGIIIVKREQ